jgi:antitoxin (DNA-binding transcriptional repressor) of toxin-antitoxin stability system
MKALGVRQLRQRASEYLRLVEGGRALEVTARGPVSDDR